MFLGSRNIYNRYHCYMRIRKPTRMFSYSTNKCKEGLMTAVFVSARSADILLSPCVCVCVCVLTIRVDSSLRTPVRRLIEINKMATDTRTFY